MPLPCPLAKTRSSPVVTPLVDRAELVVADVDDPGALAERDAGQRGRIGGVELALRPRRPERQRGSGQAQAPQRLNGQTASLDRLHERSCHSPEYVDCEEGRRSGNAAPVPCGVLDALTGRALYTSAVQFRRDFHLARHWRRRLGPLSMKIPRFQNFEGTMSRRCELTGKGPMIGHTVSHSNIKTKRRFLPNLFNVTMMSDALGRSVRLRVSANAIRIGRPSRRPRCLPGQGQGRRTVARRSTSSARSRRSAQREAVVRPADSRDPSATPSRYSPTSVNCSRIVRCSIEKLSSDIIVRMVVPSLAT